MSPNKIKNEVRGVKVLKRKLPKFFGIDGLREKEAEIKLLNIKSQIRMILKVMVERLMQCIFICSF